MNIADHHVFSFAESLNQEVCIAHSDAIAYLVQCFRVRH
jgi:hypothetical protein